VLLAAACSSSSLPLLRRGVGDPETAAATLVRKAFNDFAGFVTGWVLFLDYLIVIALAALFLPHYLGGAFGVEELRERPWDVVVAVGVIVTAGLVRLVRRPGLRPAGMGVAGLDLVTQLLLVVLGLSLLFSPDALRRGIDIGTSPSWHELAFALPLAMLAYTGLETVANYAEEATSPGRDLPRGLFSGIGVVVAIYVAIAVVGLSAFRPENGETELGDVALRAAAPEWRALPGAWADVMTVVVGVSGALCLLAAVTTSFSGFGRLAYSLGEHGMLPRASAARPKDADRRRRSSRRSSYRGRRHRGGCGAENEVHFSPPVQLRRAHRLRRGAAGRDPSPLHRAVACAAVPRPFDVRVRGARSVTARGSPAHRRACGSSRWCTHPGARYGDKSSSQWASPSTSSCGDRGVKGCWRPSPRRTATRAG
jgi:hypothetical protein